MEWSTTASKIVLPKFNVDISIADAIEVQATKILVEKFSDAAKDVHNELTRPGESLWQNTTSIWSARLMEYLGAKRVNQNGHTQHTVHILLFSNFNKVLVS